MLELVLKLVIFIISVFNSEISIYRLWKNVILNLEVSIYIYNNCKHFQDFWTVSKKEFIYTSNIVILIEDIENTIITINISNRIKKIKLIDIVYILSFYTTIISLKKFIVKRVHLDIKKNWLTY